MEKIIYKTDKGISIVHPTGEFPIEDVIQKSIPKDTEYWIVDEKDIPKDRAFRNAWEWDGVKIVINAEKQQAITDKISAKEASKITAEIVDAAKTIADLKDIIKKTIST